LGEKAADTLRQALEDAQAPAAARVRAADIILARILQLRELVDLDKRLTELEKKQLVQKNELKMSLVLSLLTGAIMSPCQTGNE